MSGEIIATSSAQKLIFPKSNWKIEWQNAVTDISELWQLLKLPMQELHTYDIAHQFKLKIPHSYIQRMQVGNLADPLLRQVLISPEELLQVSGYIQDPLQEKEVTLDKGLLKKYAKRLLVITSGACPVHCRYCFRRHFPYHDHTGITQLRQQLHRRLTQDLSINEVILSGGDPLSLDDDTLFELIAVIESIPHIKTLRIHTRFPVVIPNRLTSEFISRLANSRLRKVCIFHINHPNEINIELTEKTQRMHAAGIQLLNQSVLLKGVNDNEQTLERLSEALWRSNILPYYIHQLDAVDGAAHFAVNDSEAITLIANLRNQLSGYLVPQLVREYPGASSKTLLYR